MFADPGRKNQMLIIFTGSSTLCVAELILMLILTLILILIDPGILIIGKR